MKSLLKTFERASTKANGPSEAATTFEQKLANLSHSDTPSTREIVRGRGEPRRCPEGLDQFGRSRRSARQVRSDTAARRENDLRTLQRNAYSEDRLADDSGVRRRTGGATEVHA
jgi:hypothetical protein